MLDQVGFEILMRTLADAWNNHDPDRAAACFAEDVVYVEPPDKQRYVGRAEIYKLSDAPGMTMTFHHLVFDESQQIGCGEYTFRGRRQYHGLVIVSVRGDLIARWREYQYTSDLDWDEFVGDSRFTAAAE